MGTKKEEIHLVRICRQIDSYVCAEYPAERIQNVKWDNISGGVNKKQAGYSLYGYIPYKEAAKLIDCSGQHDFGYNDAKVCIRAIDNKDPSYKKGYNYLMKCAGTKPYSNYNAAGLPPCTKRILLILDEKEEITRLELREKLQNEGYNNDLVCGAIKRLEKSQRITISDARNPQKRIIRKFSNDS